MQFSDMVPVKPRLRGVSHQWAFFVALVAGAVLVIAAPAGRATLAAAIYAISVAGLFGASALYHRVDWKSVGARRWMRRLDHSMIFVLIAGTYTPFALLVLDGGLARAILIAVWGGAAARDRAQDALARHAQVADRRRVRGARLGRGGRVPGAGRRARRRRHGAGRAAAACSTRPARSSTRCGAPTRRRPCSATTRSSTCS